jgi:hypothetical protein
LDAELPFCNVRYANADCDWRVLYTIGMNGALAHGVEYDEADFLLL